MTHLPHHTHQVADHTDPVADPTEPITDVPTPGQVTALARRIADSSLDAHAVEVMTIARTALRAGHSTNAAQVLMDPTESETVRLRAFLTIARHWPEIHTAALEWQRFETTFDALAAQAEEHHRLRANGDIGALWRSRAKLDEIRVEAARHRLRVALS